MKIADEIHRKWKPRKLASHKGNFGRAFILAGSRGLAGAAHLASTAALRSGAGLVTLGVPEKIYTVVARREAEIMVRPFASNAAGSLSDSAAKPVLDFLKSQDVFALGPGLSQNPQTQKLIRKLISSADLPLVLDADGLNALKGHLECLRRCKGRAILTPHPGEFQRLFEKKVSSRQKDRREKAIWAATKYGIILVLKGHRTVVASPDGKVFINTTGNPGMAKGGTGDVLTGVIAALIGQRFSFWDAARFGVYLHGLAGDMAAKKIGEISLTAGDILNFLPATIRTVY